MTDWKKVGRDLWPYFWREVRAMAYTEAGQEGLQTFHDDVFKVFEAEVIEILTFNGQHTVLEEYLNDTYDDTLRRIFITENDVVRAFGVDIPLNGEFTSSPVDIGINTETNTPEINLGINSDSTVTFLNNFTINIPAALTLTAAEEDLLRRRIDRWVEAHMRYNIVYF